jgi:nucleotide-binding universal stress UspA family protein
MAIKDILVHLDTTETSPARLALAARLAAQHGAHLVGVLIVDIPPASFFYGAAIPFLPAAPDEIVERMREDGLAAAVPVEQAFRECLRREGVEGEWRLAEGPGAATLALHARYADLAVVGQTNPKGVQDGSDGSIPVAAVLGSGRPVLTVPFAGDFPTIGKRVLVAWNASREAARAVADALPLLQAADHVTILAINPRRGIGGHGDVPAADIALHLARHGVQAEAAHTVAKDIADGEALLSYASDISADLIVAGAYGHSRMRETVFGGVTRTLLAEMTVPVLLSH